MIVRLGGGLELVAIAGVEQRRAVNLGNTCDELGHFSFAGRLIGNFVAADGDTIYKDGGCCKSLCVI